MVLRTKGPDSPALQWLLCRKDLGFYGMDLHLDLLSILWLNSFSFNQSQ